ncbi:hypothetical protein QQF64_032310 [Cirrhinus molitorella]|uniref:Uncharacterized protein n=1 Tax=Cirrhinus molitorella TaxID=172907 RepID=A0ABR3MZM4_9TELE
MLTELTTEPLRWQNYDQTPVLLSPPSHPGHRVDSFRKMKMEQCKSSQDRRWVTRVCSFRSFKTTIHGPRTPRQTPVPSPVLLNTRKIAC